MIDELYGSTGYYIYYAHYHYDGGNCPEYEGVITESYDQHAILPEICDDCDDVGSRGLPGVGLPAPIAADKDLMTEYMKTSKATKLRELAGKLVLPDGRPIYARIGVFEVKAKIRETADGPEKEVIAIFGFGFESEKHDKDEFHALEIAKHSVGATPQKFLTEFKIGTPKCVVLTVK